jgi:hypothetical protein
MYRKLSFAACVLTLAFAQVVSCGIDTRTVSIANWAVDAGDASSPYAGSGEGQRRGFTPVLAIEPASIDFGSAVIGSPSRMRLSVLNSGGALLSSPMLSVLAGSDPDFIVLHDQCENAIGPSERCDVRLQMLRREAGPSRATLGVEADGQRAEVPLAGAGLDSGPLTLAPSAGSSGNFGGVVLGSTFEAQFDLSNPTAEPSGELSFAVNEHQFQVLPYAPGDCQAGITTLADGQSCRIRVSFSPTRRGAVDASLLVSSANLRSSSLPLAGVGRSPANLVVPDALEFGAVTIGTAGLRTLQVENLGDEPLQLSRVGMAGAMTVAADSDVGGALNSSSTSAFSVQSSDCGAGNVLVGGARCSVTVAFRPLVVAEQSTRLLIDSPDGTQHTVNVIGQGVGQGALTIAPSAGVSNDYGALTIGQSSTQTFVVTNPTAQPSGLIELRTYGDFAVTKRGTETDCQSGITSLVNGQSCEVAVTLTPSGRGQLDGALTVSSALAGAAHSALTGRGLGLAKLELATDEVDFGRVPTRTPVQQSVTVLNTGDQPLTAVRATLLGPGGGAPAGFSMVSACTGEVAVNSSCSISVEFSASDPASYSAVLELASASGGATSALLLGLAFPRGSLVVATAEGSGDFGDVALGAPRTIAFTLTNPSTTPSGRLLITASSPRFTIDPGDCNATAGAGLVNGQNCSFSVSFSPLGSEVIAANLSIQSPGAGETALPLTGRGRTPPDLNAPGTRDFGVAIVGQAAVNEAANEFTWVVTNDGDLPSGPLQLTNTNGTEFVVTSDTCSGANIPGHGSCSMDVRYLPGSIGPRTENLLLTDPASAQVFTLVMTGIGRVTAQPGQSCANGATCAVGECTGGVCCDRACAGTCQVCSATGTCTDQASREACGNGNGRCFGVNQCLLPEGQPCSGREQCGDGNCEPRLAGAGPSDRICCLEDCDSTGLVCNPQTGRCQAPNLAVNAACGAPGQLACGAGLECKSCFGGGNRCTPAEVCCGGCDPASEYACINGECACPTGTNGVAQLDCGGGLCIPGNQANVCCPSSPGCPANLPGCTSDGRCVQCLTNAQCGPCSTCNTATNTCTPLARGTGGVCAGQQLCDGAGACFTAQCSGAGAQGCGDCRTCQDFQCRAVANNTGCQGNGLCVGGTCQPGAGSACQQGGTPCANNLPCTNGRCQESGGNGEACRTGGECQSGVCNGGFCCAGACAAPCSTCAQGTGACVNAPARTACGPSGSHLLCIGGTCTLPTVRCGGVSQQVSSTMACCVSRDPFGTATETFSSLAACPPVGIDLGQATTPVTCDERTDCPAGELCCLHNDINSSSVSCVPQADCAEFFTIEVCSSPAGGAASCGVGTCGNFSLEGFVPGWQFCNP